MEKIQVHDKTFRKFLPKAEIQQAIKRLANEINANHNHEKVLFLGILNGSFMFSSDLLKAIDFQCELSFLKLASYEADSSTEEVKNLIGFNEAIDGKTVIILEDIVDTGTTLEHIIHHMQESHQPARIKIATLLYKPESYNKPYPVDYYGIKIPNKFVIGYGLDYGGLGRHYTDIYQVDQ